MQLVALAVAGTALLVAVAAWALDPGRDCRVEDGCLDERGPLHPALGIAVAGLAAVAALAAALLRRRMRSAWMAGLAFWPALFSWWPAAAVLDAATSGPVPTVAWAWPALAVLLSIAFVLLVVSRRQAAAA